LDIAGSQHRPWLLFPVRRFQTAFDSPLAIPNDLRVGSIHSKWSFVGGYCRFDTHSSTNVYGRFESFLSTTKIIALLEGLVKRWLLGTHQGAVQHSHLDYYLDEYTFRFNRRTSKSRGLLFYRLLSQAIDLGPVRESQLKARESDQKPQE
jgi:hypothetical protein